MDADENAFDVAVATLYDWRWARTLQLCRHAVV